MNILNIYEEFRQTTIQKKNILKKYNRLRDTSPFKQVLLA